MTVGIAAVCADRKAIVLMADRRLTHGDGLVTDAVMPKKRGLLQSGGKGRAGWQLLFAGNTATMEAVLEKVRTVTEPLEGTKVAASVLLGHLAKGFQQAWWEEYENNILKPRLLDRRSFRERPKEWADLSDSLVEEVESEAGQRAQPFGVDFILAGFGANDDLPVLATVRDGEVEPEMMTGFTAVGEAEGVSMARLIFTKMSPADQLERALYKVYDAKAHAELFGSVGERTQAWVMVLGREQPIEVPLKVMQALETLFDLTKVWPWLRRPEAPVDYLKTIASFCQKAMGLPAVVDDDAARERFSPTERERPS